MCFMVRSCKSTSRPCVVSVWFPLAPVVCFDVCSWLRKICVLMFMVNCSKAAVQAFRMTKPL